MTLRRMAKIAGLSIAQKVGVMSLSKRTEANSIRILCYHGGWRVDDHFAGDAMFMRRDVFARRLDLILEHGYQVVSLDDAVAALGGDAPDGKNRVVITIDDGWLGTYLDMAPELEKRGLPATLYCDTAHLYAGLPIAHVLVRYLHSLYGPGAPSDAARAAFDAATDFERPLSERWTSCQAYADAIGVDLAPYIETFSYMSPEQLRDFAERGFDVQLHTHNHTLRDFSEETITSEISENRRALSALLGRPAEEIRHFCYPSGVCDGSALGFIRQNGVASATTCELALATPANDLLLLPRLLDSGGASDVEFLAELAGLTTRLRGRPVA